MEKTVEIIKKIENFAPIETMQKWDNSGWQINLGKEYTNKVLLTLDVTDSVIDMAVRENCDMVISHHPVFFTPIKKIEQPFVIKAIQNNIQIYSAHTNLDIAHGGVCEYLAQKCGFTELDMAFDFIRYKIFNEEHDFLKLITEIKSIFEISCLKVVNGNRNEYKSIAFCSGSGGEFVESLEKIGIDVFVTGDIKHHQALNARNMTIIDISHYKSEKFVVEIFEKLLRNLDIEVVTVQDKPAWELL